ncbi:MAG: hypothetical protein JSS95_09855 [Acidobacteria bacterium]|nr:hypothetical protein [Acidobacteriota bacterium]
MKNQKTLAFAASLMLAAAFTPLLAQQTTPPPKVLVISREFLKPGKSPSQHQRTESAYVSAMTAAKWPTHYFAMDAMTGAPRTLFFTPYDSFEAWDKDAGATDRNHTLTAALDRAYSADGELLSGYDSAAFTFRDDLSLRAPVDIPHMRYFEISHFVVRPGHVKDFMDLAKIYIATYEKVSTEAHWAVFESQYGANNGGVFLVMIPMKSLAETDRGLTQSKDFVSALGEDGMKKLSELTAASVESVQTNLFRINPHISYPPEPWVQADPSFWKPKPSAAPKPATKPAD